MTLVRLTLVCLLFALVGCAPSGSPHAGKSSAGDPATAQSSHQTLRAPIIASVLYFEDRTHRPDLRWLSKGLADMLITDLSQASGVQVVQRERLEELLREQRFQVGGRVEEKTAVRIGRMTGATVILIGSAVVVGDTLRLDVHLTDVERGTVVGAVSVQGTTVEVLSLEKQLAAKIMALLQIDAVSPSATPGQTGSRDAARAFYEGVDAADRGNVGEALNKFEAALEKEPKYGEARRRYERTLRNLNADALWSHVMGPEGRAQDRFRVGARILDDLFNEGFTADLQELPGGARNATTNEMVFRVQLGIDDQAIQHLREEVQRLQGREREQEGRLVFEVEDPEIRASFGRALGVPRRMFLHFESSDGRQVLIYSLLKQWNEHPWVSLDAEGRLVLEVRQRLLRTVVLPDLFSDGPGWPTTMWVSVDPVPHETATLQVEILSISDHGREILIGPVGRASKPAVSDSNQEIRTRLAQELLETWNPPVWERVPGPGYLPSARRSVIVVSQIRSRQLVDSHLAGFSGDPQYDQACLNAVTQTDNKRLEPLLTQLEKAISGPTRVRVSCVLLKDIPSLQESRQRL